MFFQLASLQRELAKYNKKAILLGRFFCGLFMR